MKKSISSHIKAEDLERLSKQVSMEDLHRGPRRYLLQQVAKRKAELMESSYEEGTSPGKQVIPAAEVAQSIDDIIKLIRNYIH